MSLSSPLTLAIVKIELGITDGSLDAEITERIPFAEAKFRLIAGYQFRYVLNLKYDNSSDIIKVFQLPNSQIDFIDFGAIILSLDFPDGTYVIENYRVPFNNIDSGEEGIFYEIKLSASSSAQSSSFFSDAILSYNISNYAVLSQIVFYMIGKQDITKQDPKEVKSRRVGPLSWTFSDASINVRHGLPQPLVDAIPKYEGMY